MSGIKKILQDLSEDDLRKKIIIPYLDISCIQVEDWCGPSEKGKDIVYVRKDMLSQDVTGAVIIKKENIRKSGTKNTHIREIKNQVEEAYSSEIPFPLDPDKKTHIQEIYVLTPYGITPEARDYINENIGKKMQVRFINGDQLVLKIETLICNTKYTFNPYNFKEICHQNKKIFRKELEFPQMKNQIGDIKEDGKHER